MDVYLHVKVLLSMILGLGVAHLLRGVARIVQHPKKYPIYWVHLLWTLFLFLYLIHFWWWEFGLSKVQQWTFPLYLFIALYATLLYLICSLLFPDDMSDYRGYKDYFCYRRRWIFALLAILFLLDFVDTAIKGPAYGASLGVIANTTDAIYIVLCLLAIGIRSEAGQVALAGLAVTLQVAYIIVRYMRS